MAEPAWKEKEVAQLMKKIKEKKTIEEIALLHKRTQKCIMAKLKSIARTYYINNMPFNEIHELTGIQKDDIVIRPKPKALPKVEEEPKVEDLEEPNTFTLCKIACVPIVDVLIACALLLRLRLLSH